MQILLQHNADPNMVSADFGPPMAAVLSVASERISESAVLKCMKILVKGVEGIIDHAKLRHSKNKSEQSDKDSNIQLNLNTEKATKKEDSSAPKPCSKDKRGDKDKKAELKLLGSKQLSGRTMLVHQNSTVIEVNPEDATLYSNRGLCHLRSGERHDTLLDADACIRLQPDWPKGYYQKGTALMSLKEYKEACDAFLAGGELDPASVVIREAFWEAIEAMKKEHSPRQNPKSSD